MEIVISPSFNYSFNFHIEQVYRCYNCYNITAYLKKKGFLRKLNYEPQNSIDSSLEKEILLENTYIVRKYPEGDWKILVKKTKNTHSFKQFKFVFKDFDGKPFDDIFNLVFSFHENIEDNSTLFSFNIECSKKVENWINNYFSGFPHDWHLSMCQDYEKYLNKWFIPEPVMESIFINSSAEILYRQILDGSIFLTHPHFKGSSLVIDRKEGLIGTSYLFMKKKEKLFYIIKSVEETPEYFKITLKKKTGATSFDNEIQYMIIKLDEQSSLLQYYTQFLFPINTRYFPIFQQKHKKMITRMKKMFEKNSDNRT